MRPATPLTHMAIRADGQKRVVQHTLWKGVQQGSLVRHAMGSCKPLRLPGGILTVHLLEAASHRPCMAITQEESNTRCILRPPPLLLMSHLQLLHRPPCVALGSTPQRRLVQRHQACLLRLRRFLRGISRLCSHICPRDASTVVLRCARRRGCQMCPILDRRYRNAALTQVWYGICS